MESLGVFFCTGCDIGEGVAIEKVQQAAEEKGKVKHCQTHACLCSPEGVAGISSAIDENGLDGILIAACSPRVKADLFNFDRKKIALERASLREQCVWSHEPGHEDTQMLAEDLVRMGVARLSAELLPGDLDEKIDRTVLVVGAGLAGLNASVAAAGLGHPVVLVEAKDHLGGYLADVTKVVPEHPPYTTPAPNPVADLVLQVEANDSIQVHKSTKIESIKGQPGQFAVKLAGPAGAAEITVGAIVQATGADPYDASKLTKFGFGASKDVVTSHDMERFLKEGQLKRPSDGKTPKSIVFVQCAGSRDAEHLSYCSAECCATSVKQVAAIHEIDPEIDCTVVYKDLRTPAQLERFYLAVQDQPGSLFMRGDVSKVSANGTLAVEVAGNVPDENLIVDADLVVLATGMVPHAADGTAIRAFVDAKKRFATTESDQQREQAAQTIEKLKAHENTEILNLAYRQGPDLPALEYGFADSHYICFPYETRRTGVYAAGTMRAPMDSSQAAEDGWGAAMKAVQNIRSNERGEAVHPRAGDVSIADFALQRCTQCKRCTEECPFGSIDEDEKGTPKYNPLRCRRCGICMGACPERIISFPEASVESIASMIKSVEVPDELDEKPRILVFMCENDAIPALDEAARQRLRWNPWIRIVPVRCLGSVNTVWVADSLSSGFDGVMMIGCKKGDDYQCHYMDGSELAAKRMTNVSETLDRLALESERLKVVELAHDEFGRVLEIIEEFAETIEEVGPNPYKGF